MEMIIIPKNYISENIIELLLLKPENLFDDFACFFSHMSSSRSGLGYYLGN